MKELYGYYGGSIDCDKDFLIPSTPAHIVDDLGGELSKSKNGTLSLCFSDPLLQELCDSPINNDDQVWCDPMVWNENIEWTSPEISNPCLNPISPMATPMSITILSRPRGRPRKSSSQQKHPETPSHSMLEARKTWETAQLLGISSYEEEAVLSGLRKSKRILNLEGKGD